jgi:alcohol dehydrogenase (cytochrome c)
MRALLVVLALGGVSSVSTGQESVPELRPVTWERLKNAAAEPRNWLMYSGTLDSQRFSRLDQVRRENVSKLELKWAYQIPQIDRAQTVPLVVDSVMFITEAPSNVTAVHAGTGRPYWRYEHELPEDLRLCCGRNNRGVAILGDTLFMSTLDAHLVAIDARNGSLKWNAELANHKSGYSKTDAPLVVKNLVVTGIAGGEYGIRGFLDAYDPKTGDRVWRLYTVPGPGEPGNDSWPGDSWKTGGAPTWLTGSYDPDLDLVYWGTGNPGPDWNGEGRMGDNLYADSALAVDADTGKLAWYFQFTPWDVHDWDAIQIPILADLSMNGETRKVMMWANRNSFFYTLDRKTGEFLVGKPFAKQTWAQGLDEKGRPIRVPGKLPTREGNIVSPPILGGTNWYSPAYSPKTELFYVNAYDGEQEYFLREEEYREGEQFTGGGARNVKPVEKYQSFIRAIDPRTGETRWEFEVQPRSSSGLLATAGDLIFGGTMDGYFYALDADTGRELWHLAVGARVHSAPITYAVDGQQLVTIAAGNVVFTFGLD